MPRRTEEGRCLAAGRFTIQLKFIYSICQTLCSWPGRAITPGLSDGRDPLPALPVRLQDFSTSPAHH